MAPESDAGGDGGDTQTADAATADTAEPSDVAGADTATEDVLASEDAGGVDGGTPDTSSDDTASPDPEITLDAVTPTTVLRTAGSGLTLTGTGFVDGIGVTVGGQPCADLQVVSATTAKCNAPAQESVCGSQDVVITHKGGTTAATLPGAVVYFASTPSFSPGSVTFDAGLGASALAVADVDGDGHLDVVSTASGDGTVRISRGDGQGSFAASESLPVQAASPRALLVTDVTGDGTPEIVALSQDTTPSVTVLVRNGTTWTAKVSPITTEGFVAGRALAAGQIDQDGHVDLVAGQDASLHVQTLLGDGLGSFTVGATRAVGGTPSALALTDMNADDRDDLISVNTLTNSVSVCLMKQDAFLNPVSTTTGARPEGMALIDQDGQPPLDVVVANREGANLSLLIADGSGSFAPATSVDPGLAAPTSVVVADLDFDGDSDLLSASADAFTLSVNLSSSGGFATALQTTLGQKPTNLAIGDVDEDGLLDVVYLTASDAFGLVLQGCE